MRLYADRRHSILVLLQGMDSSGKDGAIRHVLSGLSPQGVSVVNFKTPSELELSHDFLWRAARTLPARGEIGIFNRSYYEETLITRVHPELLRAERLPSRGGHDGKFWRTRYESIRNFERYLETEGTTVIKIFLHISKEEQRTRLLSRFADPKKLWKISESDVRERAYWKEYQAAYAETISYTATKHGPWLILPADDKPTARLLIAEVLVDRLKALKPAFPEKSAEEVKKLNALRTKLEKE